MRLYDTSQIFNGSFLVGEAQLLEHFDKIEAQAKRIHAYHPDRDFDRILQNCFDGTVTEVGIVNALLEDGWAAELNQAEFDKKDPNTFAWDLKATREYGTVRFEVKSMDDVRDMKYFSFNIDSKKPGLDLTTFCRHGLELTDFLVLAAFTEDKINNAYSIIPKYVFDSKQFKQHIQRSNGGGLTHYVDVSKMIAARAAILVQ